MESLTAANVEMFQEVDNLGLFLLTVNSDKAAVQLSACGVTNMPICPIWGQVDAPFLCHVTEAWIAQ